MIIRSLSRFVVSSTSATCFMASRRYPNFHVSRPLTGANAQFRTFSNEIEKRENSREILYKCEYQADGMSRTIELFRNPDMSLGIYMNYIGYMFLNPEKARVLLGKLDEAARLQNGQSFSIDPSMCFRIKKVDEHISIKISKGEHLKKPSVLRIPLKSIPLVKNNLADILADYDRLEKSEGFSERNPFEILYKCEYKAEGIDRTIELFRNPDNSLRIGINYDGCIFLEPEKAKIVLEILNKRIRVKNGKHVFLDKSISLLIQKTGNGIIRIKVLGSPMETVMFPPKSIPLIKENLAAVLAECEKLKEG